MVRQNDRNARNTCRMMTLRLLRPFAIALAGVVLASASALAHPHVWVTMKSELVYAPDGAVTGIRQAWTFDDMYSTFATQGLESKQKGLFTREDLAPLTEVNVTSLKEFDYFTFAKANGKKALFTDPDLKDAWLEFNDSLLTLYFTLPFKTPVKANALDIEVFDPSYFIDFSFADTEPVRLVGAPAQCRFKTHKPTDAEAGVNVKKLNEANFLEANDYGAMFANKISVTCR
jgi:ABC-type uncharacterized transport system substrate-binding protein